MEDHLHEQLQRLRIHQEMGTMEPIMEVLLHPILHWVLVTPSTFLEVIITPGLQPAEMRPYSAAVMPLRSQFGIRNYPIMIGNHSFPSGERAMVVGK